MRGCRRIACLENGTKIKIMRPAFISMVISHLTLALRSYFSNNLINSEFLVNPGRGDTCEMRHQLASVDKFSQNVDTLCGGVPKHLL